MKQSVIWLMMTVCGLMTAVTAVSAEFKPAVVSMERLFDEYHRTLAFNADLKKRAESLEARREKLTLNVRIKQRELEQLTEESRDRSLSTTERDRKKRQAEEAFTTAREAEEAVMEFDRTEKRRFGEEMRNAQQELVREITVVIADYSKKHGYTLVLDMSGKTLNGVESVVYFEPGLDITAPILTILNKSAD